jgi:hypothetical protein
MPDFRRVAVACAFVGLFAWSDHPLVQLEAAPIYDWCYNTCGSEESCETECENDGGGTTTCGEYHDGPIDGWCDGDTCEDVCGAWAPPSQECWDQGNPTDCYGYDSYAQCGDDVCSEYGGGEDCHTCPQDCGFDCPIIECGDLDCDDYESYRNCPNDCDIPDPQAGYCGDGTCDTDEDDSCEDCQLPGEFCDGWDYYCPSGWQCTGNQCIHEEYLFELDNCPNGQADCDTGDDCRDATNPFTLEPFRVCVPFIWDD